MLGSGIFPDFSRHTRQKDLFSTCANIPPCCCCLLLFFPHISLHYATTAEIEFSSDRMSILFLHNEQTTGLDVFGSEATEECEPHKGNRVPTRLSTVNQPAQAIWYVLACHLTFTKRKSSRCFCEQHSVHAIAPKRHRNGNLLAVDTGCFFLVFVKDP